MLENVEGERHLHALPLLLDAQQGALKVQPERDLLRMRRGQFTRFVPHRNPF